MRRSFIISDWFYRLRHAAKRNRVAVILYTLCSLLFIVIGVAVGVNVADKAAYAGRNGATIFVFLRGDSGIVSFFFSDVFFTTLYCVFSLSMFFFRATTVLSLAPCMYKSYVLGMHTCIIIAVFTASSLPMLFVLYVPIGLIEICILCTMSYKCFAFAAQNVRCTPSKIDIKQYYKSALPYLIVIVVGALVKALTVSLFGSALIGVIGV